MNFEIEESRWNRLRGHHLSEFKIAKERKRIDKEILPLLEAIFPLSIPFIRFFFRALGTG